MTTILDLIRFGIGNWMIHTGLKIWPDGRAKSEVTAIISAWRNHVVAEVEKKREAEPVVIEASDDHVVMALVEGRCPDCNNTEFWTGPRGGSSVNILCDWCGHEFNFCEIAPPLSHRNSVSFDPQRNWAYGLAEDWVPAVKREGELK